MYRSLQKADMKSQRSTLDNLNHNMEIYDSTGSDLRKVSTLTFL